MKVALVYDRVNKIGGAERILSVLHELYPDAPLYTLVHYEKRAPWSKDMKIHTSFLQKIPFARIYHEFFPLLPIFAFEQFDFTGFDVVISVTATEAKGIITSPAVLHICYLLTPTRYLWSHYETYFANPMLKFISAPIVSMLRLWDLMAAQRPDEIVAISQAVKDRVSKYYRRKAEVIYPPVNTEKFRIKNESLDLVQDRKLRIKGRNYFLIVSRLVRYKRIEIAIEACNKLQLPLKIVGEGLEKGKLEKIAGPTVEFLGNLTDSELSHYYQNCRALLVPQEEDLGLVAIEALSCGVPVIAFEAGGAKEIVVPGKNGELFAPQTTEGLMRVLEKFDTNAYSRDFCRRSAMKFSQDKFMKRFADFVDSAWGRFKKGKEI